MDPLGIGCARLRKTEPDSRALVNGDRASRGALATEAIQPMYSRKAVHADSNNAHPPSPNPGAAAALAFDDLVALLQQPLALAILALLLLLDVGTLFTGHFRSPALISRPCTRSGL